MWQAVDRRLTNDAYWLPYMNWWAVGVVSSRVGNFTSDRNQTVLLSQLWVR